MYPQDVAYPIGGRGNPQYVILEMHYDNPNEDAGKDVIFHTIDNKLLEVYMGFLS